MQHIFSSSGALPSPHPITLPDGRTLAFDARRLIMGIVNTTPDSFSDGGQFDDTESAIAHARALLAQGADILDIGGESTRPGAAKVSLDEELQRTIPVIRGIIAAHPDAVVSIDTTKAEVARQAIDAGASIINDISGMTFDEAMPSVAATARAPVIVMHIRGTPETMQDDTSYVDVVAEVTEFLQQRVEVAREHGIPITQLILDPGIGFGKSVEQNYEIIRRLPELTALGHAVLIGTSRKSLIGKLLDKPATERLLGTAATVAGAIMTGAHIIRVHDVDEMVDVVRVTEAICGLERSPRT